MLYAKVKMSGGNGYVQPMDELGAIVDEITEAAECNAVGRQWVIDLVEMSDEEFEALPEFVGH